MKILVIQLARFGDLFQTLPVVAGLRRTGHEVHLLARQSYAGGVVGWIDEAHLKTIDVKAVLRPLISDEPDLSSSLGLLDDQLGSLWSERYDQVINLSFSPFSSFLTSAFEQRGSRVRGYSRTEDGYLGLADDPSAYFFGQVGVDSFNRLHLCDLFAQVADIDLTPADFSLHAPTSPSRSEIIDRVGQQAILVHPCASEPQKTLNWSKWSVLVQSLLGSWPGEIVLIGSESERTELQRLVGLRGPRKAINLAGESDWSELFRIMGRAKLLIGGDSGPIHLATLAGLKTLNISVGPVRHWETGPLAPGSVVIRPENAAELPMEAIARYAQGLASGGATAEPNIESCTFFAAAQGQPDFVRYQRISGEAGSAVADCAWQMIQALYMSAAFPPPVRAAMQEACAHLLETHQIAIDQIALLQRQPRSGLAVEILKRVDEVSSAIAKFVPELEPVVRWYEAEKVRVKPGPEALILEQHLDLHNKVKQIMRLYVPDDGAEDQTMETPHESSDLESGKL